MLLDSHSHLHDLVVGVVQQEVKVIQWGWVLVLEPVQQSLLDHSKLNSSLFKQLTQLLLLFPELEVNVNIIKQVLQRQILVERDNLVDLFISKHVF
jgi:hypothetical protein